MTKRSDLDPVKKQKRIAWDIATTVCLQSKEDPVMIYSRIMREYESKTRSCETQISGNS